MSKKWDLDPAGEIKFLKEAEQRQLPAAQKEQPGKYDTDEDQPDFYYAYDNYPDKFKSPYVPNEPPTSWGYDYLLDGQPKPTRKQIREAVRESRLRDDLDTSGGGCGCGSGVIVLLIILCFVLAGIGALT